ncbi:MAG: phage portal protein, partial [Spirochaetes bacterium GWB1_59_5]
MAIADLIARFLGEPSAPATMEIEAPKPRAMPAPNLAPAPAPLSNLGPARRQRRRQERFSYTGAKTDRLNSDWRTNGSGANTEIAAGLATLRNRSSDLARNNPYALKALESLTANIVSSGIRARWDNPRAQELWDAWTVDADVGSDLDLYGLQMLAVRSWLERGDTVIRRRWRRLDDPLAVPFQIEVMEGDFLDHQKTTATAIGGRIVQGVEFDPIGRRSAYWLHKTHPGETGITGSSVSAPIDAADIAHLYRATRAGQVRGIPWLAAVIQALRDLERYEAAERNRKRSQAGMVGVLIPRDETFDPDSTDAVGLVENDSEGDPVDQIEPNSSYVARGGASYTFSSPASDQGYPQYMSTQLHGIAAGALTSYENLTNDLREINYSSFRAGDVEQQRVYKAVQTQVVIPLFLRRVAQWFLDAAIVSGQLPAG